MHAARSELPASCADEVRGFTAIELMVTIAILAILAAIAAPSFSSTIENWRVRNAAEDFRSSFYFARSEAIKRGGDVKMRPLAGGWSNGWKIVNTHSNPQEDLRQVDTQPKATVNGSSTEIKFNRWGMVAGIWPSFTFYPQGKTDADPATRKACINAGGRIRIVRGASC